jgi:ABC-2 type transport system ATP-binding protein
MRGLGLPLERRASTLSGGERAQVVLSLALAARTRVLLLDEPLASLDPLARREFLRVLQTAARENHQTVVLSSHILGDIEAICDWIVLLRAGRVVLQGSIAAVLEAHRIADGPGSGDVVARYLDLDGSLKTLVRSTSGRKPTLEEVVIAYLAGPPGSPRLA